MTNLAVLARDLRQLADCANRLAGTLEGGLASLAKPEAVMANAMQTIPALIADTAPTSDPGIAGAIRTSETRLTLTQDEVAAMLGVHPRTLQRLRAAGEGPKPITIGRSVRYRRADVLRFVEGKRS